jgi:hypothetical protein
MLAHESEDPRLLAIIAPQRGRCRGLIIKIVVTRLGQGLPSALGWAKPSALWEMSVQSMAVCLKRVSQRNVYWNVLRTLALVGL